MANFRNTLHETDEFRAESEPAQDPRQADTAVEAVEPVLQLEKGDLEFWMQVATVVLLFLIWREQARGGV